MMANPFYAINIHPALCAEHRPLIDEETFVKCAVRSIAEDGDGGAQYIRHLLANLKGDHLIEE